MILLESCRVKVYSELWGHFGSTKATNPPFCGEVWPVSRRKTVRFNDCRSELNCPSVSVVCSLTASLQTSIMDQSVSARSVSFHALRAERYFENATDEHAAFWLSLDA